MKRKTKNEQQKTKLIVALDTDDLKKAKALVDMLSGVVKFFKIGSILFTAHGLEAINMVRAKGCEVFLDLKFHDIPHTVKRVSSIITRYKVFMFNVHSLGGERMMAEAADAARRESKRLNIRRPLVLGVTILTSIDKNMWQDLGVKGEIKSQVIHLARLSKRAGLDGVVASAQDAPDIRANLGEDFIILSAGIRPEWASIKPEDDQRRFATPLEAVRGGCNYIVLGRPITEAPNPREAVERVLAEIT
jgi:orotidine-5'-phosphate decarboxylase